MSQKRYTVRAWSRSGTVIILTKILLSIKYLITPNYYKRNDSKPSSKKDFKWKRNIARMMKKVHQCVHSLQHLPLQFSLLVHLYTAIIESAITAFASVWLGSASSNFMRKLHCIVHLRLRSSSFHCSSRMRGRRQGMLYPSRPNLTQSFKD